MKRCKTVSIRKGRRGKRGKKERGKHFQMKEKNENISFNFYLQVLGTVLASTTTEILKQLTLFL